MYYPQLSYLSVLSTIIISFTICSIKQSLAYMSERTALPWKKYQIYILFYVFLIVNNNFFIMLHVAVLAIVISINHLPCRFTNHSSFFLREILYENSEVITAVGFNSLCNKWFLFQLSITTAFSETCALFSIKTSRMCENKKRDRLEDRKLKYTLQCGINNEIKWEDFCKINLHKTSHSKTVSIFNNTR